MGFLLALCLLVPAADGPGISQDEKLLAEAKLPTDGPGLLDFFKRRTPSEASRARTQLLIRQLGDDSFKVRQQASRDLVAQGPLALPLLRVAAKDTDLEVKRRALQCIQRIEDTATSVFQITAAARVLAVRKPAGAAEVLLDFLAGVEEEAAADDIRAALAVVAVRDGQPEKVLVSALTDKSPLRRAAAGAALARAGVKQQQAAVRKLLSDPDAGVRLRVGLALVEGKDKDAIPALIALLADLPRERCWPVEELLYRLAGERAPDVAPGDDPAGRRKFRDAWTAWWKKYGPEIDAAKLGELKTLLGLLFAVVADNTGCTLIEYGPNGKERWRIPNLNNSVDVYVLPGNRVLIAEYGRGRVIECDFKGKVLWEKKVQGPYAAQRLPNGNTFIATQSQLLEVDAKGKELWTMNVQSRAAYKFPNGQIALMGDDRQFRTYDASRKQIKSVNIPFQRGNTIGGIEFLPGGRILIADGNTLKEYDANGKKVWDVAVQDPDCLQRLPNGNTLVASMGTNRIIEVNRAGKIVWEKKAENNGRPWMARRR
jgi:HEAT repeat protein